MRQSARRLSAIAWALLLLGALGACEQDYGELYPAAGGDTAPFVVPPNACRDVADTANVPDDGGAPPPDVPCACQNDADCAHLAGPCLATPRCVDCACVAEPLDFTPCTPDDACALSGVCAGGSCQAQGTRDCDDQNPCTDDACVAGQGCTHTQNTAACNDGNACTTGDACNAGRCRGTPGDQCACQADVDCLPFDDGNLCNGTLRCFTGTCAVDANSIPTCPAADPSRCEVSVCEPASGLCIATARPDGAACSDQNACTSGDLCIAGACVGAAGGCGCATTADCAAFDDGDRCNGELVCDGGACVVDAATLVDCGPVGPCEVPTCDPATGSCGTAPLADGTTCDDGNPCTGNNRCAAGVCGTGTALACDDGNACTTDRCDPGSGCAHDPAEGPCEDGNPCTTGDTCNAGVCEAGAPDPCEDGNDCTDDFCDRQTGCGHTPNTAFCEDGIPCTSGDRCEGGQCQPGANICGCTVDADCAPFQTGDPCQGTLICVDDECVPDPATVPTCPPTGDPCQVNTCQAGTGDCAIEPARNGTPCDDANACTPNDSCQAGTCLGSGTTPCNDGDPCTEDSCDPTEGCVTTPIVPCGPVCGDGGCTGGETCEDCPDDCGPCAEVCGNGSCGGGETAITCHTDCAPDWLRSGNAGFHGAAFVAGAPDRCTGCHGADLTGGADGGSCETCHSGWKTNCTFCHGGADNDTGAPPTGLEGETQSSQRAVGAHTVHVEAGARKVAYDCNTCHRPTGDALAPGHMDGDATAEVTLSDCAGGTYNGGTCSNVYCHGNGQSPTVGGSATWTGAALNCQSCHAQANQSETHEIHILLGFNCATCHNQTVNAAGAISDPARHVNCVNDVSGSFTWTPGTRTCSSVGCHNDRPW